MPADMDPSPITDMTLLVGLNVARLGHAEPGGDRRGGMGRAERIVGAFGPLGETRQAAALAQVRIDRAVRSGSCADSIGARRPRSACHSVC
jgi:hypothetical protein